MSAVNQDGRALEFASLDMQGDREIVMNAVINFGRALKFASSEL